MTRTSRIVAALSMSLVFACGDDTPSSTEAPEDAGVDTPADSDVTDTVDIDADADAGLEDVQDDVPDSQPDAEEDPSDTSPDSDADTVDVSEDPTADADAADALEDTDTELDTPPDSEPDAEPDAEPDVVEPDPLTCAAVDPVTFDEAVLIEFDPAASPQDDAIFDLGVQSGAARAESILLWTHIADGFAKNLVIWRDSDTDGSVWLVRDEPVTPGPVGFTHVEVEGLAPCTWYNYAFVEGDTVDGITARTAVGRFKTAHPIGSRDVVRIGATSCTSFSYQPYTALELTAGYDLDLFVHLGDQSYNDSAETLAQYRADWRRTLNDPGYRAIYPSTSMLATWDDHEVTNNWDPETITDARRSFAEQAYFETLAVERQESGALWHSYRWGDTVEFFVTDNRGERRPSTRTSSDAQYISDEQMEWLQNGLLDSDAHFKVVFSSVPITNMPGLWDLSPDDRWEGYASQRSELLDFITGNGIDDVYFLGGDFHIGFVGRVEPEGPASRIWEIAVGPGANGPNPLAFLLNEPQFEFSTNGFGTEFVTVLEFDPVASSVSVLFTDVEGEVLYDAELR